MGKIYKNGIEYGGGGGDSAGHIILDNDGTAMAEEPNLQFKGLNVTDNSTDEVTEVESAGLNQDSMDDILNASVSGNQVASNGMSYSTDEQVVGKWIDGKPVYQKTISVGNLPNATDKVVAHNISNMKYMVGLYGTAETSNGVAILLPYVNVRNATKSLNIYANTDNIYITTQENFSSYVYAYVTIQYTKTTD